MCSLKAKRITTAPSGFTLVELIVVIALIGMILVLAMPTTRDAVTVNNLKKASRQFIGLERSLRVDAVRDQVDYILLLDIPERPLLRDHIRYDSGKAR